MFDPVDPKQSFPSLEEGILKYWREEDTFKRSMIRRQDGEKFSFYDGPPFATGLPHYGHILAHVIKDVIPRYQTMRGKFVQRRFGWDCHGLPVENEIEKEKGLKTKQDIEAMGTRAFNALCRSTVQRYTGEWRKTEERIGRWVDMDWDYRTMDPDFMESIWWVFKRLHDLGLIYESHKSMHVCPRCATPLSNFEVTQGYKEIDDYAITARFLVKETGETGETREPKKKKKSEVRSQKSETYFLAWTTTGWTLPGNLFLAVGKDVAYATVESEGSRYILAKALAEKVFKGKDHQIIGETVGAKLIGMKYEPLFPYFVEKYADTAFRVVDGSEFVTTEDGTGIVHIATGYGEDDYQVGKREKVEVLQHVTIDGKFISAVTDFAGQDAKPKGDHAKGDKAVAAWLKERGKLFRAESFRHTYPHCWRCDSPLLNYATSSWFVSVEKIKQDMLDANAKTEWVPATIRDGRFGKWLEGARDWAISRNRYWGTPLPIWRDATGKVEVLGSRDELVAKDPKRFCKIIVARHAESQGNVDCIYQCNLPGTDLTAKGKKQASALANSLAEQLSTSLPLGAIYCSPLARTAQTAEAIAKKLKTEPLIDDRLKEVAFGEYEGKHIDFDDLTFVRERRAHKLATDQVESIYHFPGMEQWSDIEIRARAFLDDILEKHRGQTVVIVTHADIIMNFTHLFTGQDKHKIVHQPYPALAGSRVFYWDFESGAQLDLHKETVDEIVWGQNSKSVSKPGRRAPAKNKAHSQTVELTLMRHGETDPNVQRLVLGAETDAPLNATGRKQAKEAGKALKGQTFDVILSSHLKRARETAMIVAKELGLKYDGGLEMFREREMGEWSGKPVNEVMKRHAADAPKGARPTFLRTTPQGGESFQQFLDRARRAHDWLIKEYAGKRVLVVAHGGFNRAMLMAAKNLPYQEVSVLEPANGHIDQLTLSPQMRRIPEVLDCWFESGSMPYAQEHFPFERDQSGAPPNFPADFIAEGLDQTRGWFYTLTVLSTALFKNPAFLHCVVNGIVLAEDGKKMSKRLKNYPEPTVVVDRHGADAVRFALMSSPAVRGEDLRFSEKLVEDVLRNVLLPLWNAYRLFVTYANAAGWKPSVDFSLKNAASKDLLDRWMVAKTQRLVNKMTAELDGYDLSATCAHLSGSIDDLTNWYVRLSRRRLAGKDGEASRESFDTLYRVLICNCQLLAPFCPFISEAIYLNLVSGEHDSIHFTDWPAARELTQEELRILSLMDNTQTVTRLGLHLRSEAKIGVRTPLNSITFALPPSDSAGALEAIVKDELNVKQVVAMKDAKGLAQGIVQVDARKVGPRLGPKVQELIRAGKAGEFTQENGAIVIKGERLHPDEAKIAYVGKEGQRVAADHGIVVSLDTVVTDALKLEGKARELVRAIQQLRKDAGLEFTDSIALSIEGADDVLKTHEKMVLEETRATLATNTGKPQTISIDDQSIEIRFSKI